MSRGVLRIGLILVWAAVVMAGNELAEELKNFDDSYDDSVKGLYEQTVKKTKQTPAQWAAADPVDAIEKKVAQDIQQGSALEQIKRRLKTQNMPRGERKTEKKVHQEFVELGEGRLKKEQQKKDAELGESFSYAKLAAMDLDSELNDDSDDEKNVAESADQEPASRCMADLRLARLQIKNLAAAAKTPKTSLPAAKLKAKADAKEMEAAKDKAIAVQALKKSVQVGATQDKIMKTSMTLAKKVGKLQAQLLKVEKKAAKRKKDRQKMQGKMATLAADEATKRAKMKSRMGKLETLDIQETGAAAASKMKAQDLREEHKMVINAAENMAVGLRMKIKRINGLKKVLSLEQNKYGKLMKKHQKLMKVSKKKSNQVTACQKSSADKLRKAATKYKSSLDKHKLKMQSVQTQASLAKRALQLCEKKSQGSNARAMNRVARRENRAVQRAKKTMNKSKDKKELKKQLAVKVKAQMKKKMRKVEAKMVAKKVAKVTKKSVSQKCKACLKLSAEEKRVLSVDCNAC